MVMPRISDQRIESLIGKNASLRFGYLNEVGSGGIAEVHRVIDRELHKIVALKILLREDDISRKRLLREATVLNSLHHRNVVPSFGYTFWNANEKDYIVLDYIGSGDLKRLMDRNLLEKDSVDERERISRFLTYMVPLCDGMEELHKNKITHRDLKPSNILIDSFGNPVIIDLGLCQIDEESDLGRSLEENNHDPHFLFEDYTREGFFLGTPRYVSPEQAQCKDTNHLSDIYSFGVILYEGITGNVPFSSSKSGEVLYMQVYQDPIKPKEIEPRIPKDLEQLVLGCLEKDPNKRPQSVGKLREDLKKILFDNSEEKVIASTTERMELEEIL